MCKTIHAITLCITETETEATVPLDKVAKTLTMHNHRRICGTYVLVNTSRHPDVVVQRPMVALANLLGTYVARVHVQQLQLLEPLIDVIHILLAHFTHFVDEAHEELAVGWHTVVGPGQILQLTHDAIFAGLTIGTNESM